MPLKAFLAVGGLLALASTSLSGARAEQWRLGDVTVDVRTSPAYRACVQRAGGRNSDPGRLVPCGEREVDYWDQRLNRGLARLQQSLPEEKARDLQAFQRLWEADREEACYDSGENGMLGGLLSLGCQIRLTAQRAVDIELRAKVSSATR